MKHTSSTPAACKGFLLCWRNNIQTAFYLTRPTKISLNAALKLGSHAFFKIRNPIRNPELELDPNPRSGAPKNRIFEKLKTETTIIQG